MQEKPYSVDGNNIPMTVRYGNPPADMTRVCLFSSFSFTGIVEEYVYYYLAELQKAGFLIMFISTSPVGDTCMARLSGFCFMIIERENKCPDFGSWKTGLSLLNWGKGLEAVLFANDSVFGPFHDLRPVIASMNEKYDVWGMTENMEIDRHIQSYFIHFNRGAANNAIFATFWKNINLDATKNEVIHQYEVGLSTLFRNNQYRLGAYAAIDTLNLQEPHIYIPTNPLLLFWKTLIAKYAFPFLKRELLIKPQISKTYWMYNLYVHVGGWKKLVEAHSNYPTRYILEFLSNYSNYRRQNSPGIILGKRKIIFVAPPRAAQCAPLLSLLKWLKTETTVSAEIIIPSKENDCPEKLFTGLGRITSFYTFSFTEKRNLKERLSDEAAVVCWGSIENMEIAKFLSFLTVPQLVFVTENEQLLKEYLTTDTLGWMAKNKVHFIVTSAAAENLLANLPGGDSCKRTLVHPFTAANFEPGTAGNKRLLHAMQLPDGAFVAGIYADPADKITPGLLPAIAAMLCRQEKNIQLLWLGADLPETVHEELHKAGLAQCVHVVKHLPGKNAGIPLLSVLVTFSYNNQLPPIILDAAYAGKPVICFDEPGLTDEYKAAGIVSTIPYGSINDLVEKIKFFFTDPRQLETTKEILPVIVNEHFSVASEGPKILSVLEQYYDEEELMLAERPLVTFLTHIYYENSWEEIKYKLKDFDNGKNNFLFSVSEACLVKDQIINDIRKTFPAAYYLVTSNIGKDIGGKMALIDIYLLLGFRSDYIVFLHDKQSPHAITGESWKKGLFKIIDINNERTILSAFRDPTVGIVGDKDHIINEYDDNTESFRNNSSLSKKLLLHYDLNVENYDFLGGSMYWIRASVIEHFFRKNNPIGTRENLEAGNVLDLHGERFAHTWERMFSWIAASEGYSIKGI